ncbi:MAG: ABC transporter permease [Deltaproteobacteria bacterium]|nr:ABC transporter permease [Deltaproteobacteria bacterium]
MYYRYILKELSHHRQRMLVNCLGIAVGIALFVSINAVSAAYREAVSLPFKNLGADLVVQRPEARAVDSGQPAPSMRGIRLPVSSQIIAAGDLEKLRAVPGVDSLSTALLLWEFDRGGFRTVMGVDMAQPILGPVRVKEWLAEGRFPDREGEAVLEKHYAKFHHTKVGDPFTIGGRSFTVVGTLEIKEGSQIAAANVYLPLTDAQALLEKGAGSVNTVYLRLKDPALQDKVKSEILQTLPGVSVASSDSFLEVMGGVSRISDQFALVVSLIALAGAIFLIIKTMLANLVERAREIGILKAVGWTGADVRKQIMGEVFLQALLGGIAGIVAGYLISYLLGTLSIPVSTPWEVNLMPAFAKDAAAAAQTIRLPVSLSASLIATSLALTLASGGLASYFMARRTAKMKPADILRQL